MHSIAKLDNVTPRVFGHLYIAVFSNGTVKAGRSATDPKGRVTAHVNSGKAFDIRLDSAFYSAIYTNDTSAREKLMHQEIGLLATLTAGKEWFKFDGVDAAVNFASAYLCKVERMSFSERPSADQLADQEKKHNKRFAEAFQKFYPRPARPVTLPGPATCEQLKEIEALMNEYSLSVVSSMALRVIRLEEQASESVENAALQTPVLSRLIASHFKEFDLACHAYGEGDFSLSERIESALKNGHTLDKTTSVQIIKTAAQYPAFFFEAMRLDLEGLFGEVVA